MKSPRMRRLGGLFLSAVFLMGSYMMPAAAGIVGTERALAAQERQPQTGRLLGLLARDDVAKELERYGVDPVQARERVASLTDAELARIAPQLDQLPAGGNVVAVVGVVFVVLLILDLVGVTNVFTEV